MEVGCVVSAIITTTRYDYKWYRSSCFLGHCTVICLYLLLLSRARCYHYYIGSTSERKR